METRTSPAESRAAVERSGALAPLRISQYRWLWASNQLFFLAMQGQGAVVHPWLVRRLTDNDLALGAIAFAVALPMFLVSPFGGAFGDRVERRGLILLGQGAVVASELTLLTLLLTGHLEFWHVLAGTLVLGTVFPFIMPARQAIVMNVVGRAGMEQAMALSMTGMNASRVLGPALAGYLISQLGVEFAYATTVILYVMAWLALIPVKKTHPAATARKGSIFRGIADGVGYLRGQRLLVVLMGLGLVPMFVAMPFQTLLTVFSTEVWDAGAGGLAMLQGASGLGGVLGSIYAARIAGRAHRGRRMLASGLAFSVILIVFTRVPFLIASLPFVLMATACSALFQTLSQSAIQLMVPDHVRSRVASLSIMAFSLPLFGTLPMSGLSELYGPRATLACASLGVIGVLLLVFSTSRTLRSLDAALARSHESHDSSASR